MRALALLVLALVVLTPALAELPHFDARAPAESPSAPPVALLPKAPAWKILVVLAVPADLWSESLQGPDPEKVSGWYEDHGRQWFQETLGPELREYLLRVTYGNVPLDIEVTPWLRLPKARTEAAPFTYIEDRLFEARDALREARRAYTLENYALVLVLDPTSPGGARFADEWSKAWGMFYPQVEPGTDAIITGTFHGGTSTESSPEVATARILAHEVLHAVDFARDRRYDLHDNTGSSFCLHGSPLGGEPWLCPFNEAAALGIGPRSVGAGEHRVRPVEEGPGNGLDVSSGAGRVFLEYRNTANPGVGGQEGPVLLVWRVSGESADLTDIFREPGRSIAAGLPVEVLSLTAAGAEVRLA